VGAKSAIYDCLMCRCGQVFLQHTLQTDSGDDPMQTHINAEIDRMLTINDGYRSSAQDFPPLADSQFHPGACLPYVVCVL